MANLKIKEVVNRSEMRQFVCFPDELYVNNQYRVTPLHIYEKTILNKKENPAFEHCEAKYWLAYRDNKIVGRIAGFINWKHIEIWKENYGRFGWIDFIDDIDVAKALLDTAEEWAKSKGMIAIHGPLGFSDMDMEGMLVDGFNELGTQAVIYNHPYYPIILEKLGYSKDVDWIQKEIIVPDEVPAKLEKFAKIVADRYQLRPLKVKKAKELIPYAKSMFFTLNESFKNLYGFVPLTDTQIDYYIKQYFSIIKPEYVCFVLDKNSEVVGFGISMPSLSKALIKAKGRLFPFGFISILKAIYGKNDMIDMYLNGVRPDYQRKGVHAIYYTELIKAYIKNGIKLAITNPQLENNIKALQLWDDFKCRDHIRRRAYVKHF
ncbi:MAG: hypothetical protein A2X12_00770 [Bacteroidetes bacterium GWE2_29_8]|nr:MAG: hypothetical protein A2X12_00770 [Bacteroidetes bacterium GWE2_29_8]